MGARYDKYNPISGGFRAALAADLTLVNGEFGPKAVSLDNTGKVVVGTAGQSGIVGILVKNAARQPWSNTDAGPLGAVNAATPMGCKTGDIVDIMTDGEIADLSLVSGGNAIAGLAAGTRLYATPAGALTATASTNIPVGWTVEANRMVVRISAAVS
jgi:hypothetical protein